VKGASRHGPGMPADDENTRLTVHELHYDAPRRVMAKSGAVADTKTDNGFDLEP
jgi:hypothetical protein